jgi:hypothetical protein
MNRFLVVSIFLLCLSPLSYAKKLSVAVIIDFADSKITNELHEDLEARLNSTDRYQITSLTPSLDILLSVVCVVLTVSNQPSVLTCESTVDYYPFDNISLSDELPGAAGMATVQGDNLEYISKTLINRFINGTTDIKLSQVKSRIVRAIKDYCDGHAVACKP